MRTTTQGEKRRHRSRRPDSSIAVNDVDDRFDYLFCERLLSDKEDELFHWLIKTEDKGVIMKLNWLTIYKNGEIELAYTKDTSLDLSKHLVMLYRYVPKEIIDMNYVMRRFARKDDYIE